MGTDRNIRDEVHKELVSDPLIDADDIVIEVVNGAVSLTGAVPSQAECAEAVAAANRAVPDGVQATAREGCIFVTGTVSHNVQRVAAEDTVAGVAGVVWSQPLRPR